MSGIPTSFLRALHQRARWALICFMLAPWAAQAQSPAQLQNPGFEGTYQSVIASKPGITGQVAPGWADNSSWADVTVAYSLETSGCHGGSSCQKVALSAVRSGALQFGQVVNGRGGRLLTPGVWVRGTAGTRIQLWLQGGAPDYPILEDVPAQLTGQWQFISVPAHIVQDAAISYYVVAERPTTFWLDDATLEDRAEAVTPQIRLTQPDSTSIGLHINSYLGSKGPRNLDFEGQFAPVSSSSTLITGQVAQAWSDNSEWANVRVDYQPLLNGSNGSTHGGNKAQRLVVSQLQSGLAQALQLLYLRLGQSYTGKLWVRGTPGMRIAMGLRQMAAPYTFYGSTSTTATGAWQLLSASGTVSAQGVSALMVQAFDEGTLDFDDAQLLDATGQTPDLSLPWPAVPVGMWRLWDQSGTTWTQLEPQRGQWSWDLLDSAVADAQARGTRILLTLGQSPAWASARPGDSNYYGQGAAAEPAVTADWARYIDTVARRYQGKIFDYEIWNEPNDPTYYTGSVDKLVELTRVAQQTLKAIDVRNRVVSASPYSVGYLQQMLAAGTTPYIDVVGYHIYDFDKAPEDDARVLADVREVLRTTGAAALPLWITEGAVGTLNTPNDNAAAALLVRKYLTHFSYGASSFAWYTWGVATDFCLATTNPDGTGLSPAGAAYATLRRWLVGATLQAARVEADGTRVLQTTTAAGAPAYIVWNPNGTSQWPRPAGLALRALEEINGFERGTSNRNSIPVGPSPLRVLGVAPPTR